MNRYSLIIQRTLRNSLNSWVKAILYFLFLYLFISTSAGVLLNTGGNKLETGAYLNLTTGASFLLITAVSIYLSKNVTRDLKKGYLKNFLINNFSKQQYFFGTAIGYFILILIAMLLRILVIHLAWVTEIGMPNTSGVTYPLFMVFFLILGPIILYWATVFFVYLSFRKNNAANLQEILLLILGILTVTLTFIFATYNGWENSSGKLKWINYLLMLFPYYNLIYAVPQSQTLVGVVYWWIYLIDCFYTLILIVTFWYWRPKSRYLINGKVSNKYF